MENEEKDQFLKKDVFSQNRKPSSNSNIFISPTNNQKDESNVINKLKLGQFMFTPLEGILINKKMPHGYKFETEENILKLLEASKNLSKRVKRSDRHNDHQRHPKISKNIINEEKNIYINKEYSNINNNNNIKKPNKVIPKENSSNININISINNNLETNKIMIKCYSGLNKIKSNPISNFFYHSKFPNSPSLSMIENKIKNYEYKTINEFCDDLRKLWSFLFKNYAKEPNIYQNICKLSLLSDQICKELFNEKIIENKKEEISNVKRSDKIKKDLDEKKGNNQPEILNKNIRQKNLEEINRLSQIIRSLNKEQLKGIIYILADKHENNNSKIFEFDLEQLPFDKYKKLEEYVYNCKNNKNTNINNIHKNEKINKDMNKKDNKNNKKYNELGINDNINVNNKINKNNSVNNNIINKNIINKEKNNYNINNNSNIQSGQKKEKKIISEKKYFSDSDSMSNESSISN